MQIGKAIVFFMWLLIVFNLALSFGALWTFERMTPSIEAIRERNGLSLDYCDAMLIAVAEDVPDRTAFENAFETAGKNITEDGEFAVLENLREQSTAFFDGERSAYPQVVKLILDLAKENRNGILQEVQSTRQLQQAGAWTVVFTALVFFALAIVMFLRVKKNLLEPVNDIADVLSANHRGDHFRRCINNSQSRDIQNLCSNINDLLDRR